MLKRSILAGAAFAAAALLPGIAAAQNAFAVTSVNLRAGPGTQYPVVTTVNAGAGLNVYGCLSDWSWCDISYRGIRGWMSGRYVEQTYAGRRVLVPDYGRRIGVPVVSFNFGYWDNHYRGRSFYRDRHRWDRDWRDQRDRREAREERRDRRDAREERRDDRRGDGNWRDDRRGGNDCFVRNGQTFCR